MDDCVGNVMPALRFVTVFGAKSVARRIASREVCGKTWLLRPGFCEVVSAVADAYAANKISGAFLYSNNSSSELVEFARLLLNAIAQIQGYAARPFRAAFHRTHASRSSASDKTFADVCRLLVGAGFTAPSSPADLAFFDDQTHVLTEEIQHYYCVSKYSMWTDMRYVARAVASLATKDAKMFERARIMSCIDQDEQSNPVAHTCPPVDYIAISVFLYGIQLFLSGAEEITVF